MLDYLIKTNKLEKEFVAAGLIKTPSDTEATFTLTSLKSSSIPILMRKLQLLMRRLGLILI